MTMKLHVAINDPKTGRKTGKVKTLDLDYEANKKIGAVDFVAVVPKRVK